MASLTRKLLNISDWIDVPPEDVETSQQEFMDLVGPDFEWSGVVTSGRVAIPTVRHRNAGIVFNLVPGGHDLLGLSQAEYNAVRSLPMADESLLAALMPATDLEVRPFLMSQCPILKSLVTRVITPERALFRPDFRMVGDETNCEIPMYVTRRELEAVTSHFGFSIPTESQWEYAARAGTDSPFYFGWDLPNEATLEELLATDCRSEQTANAFGIRGLLIGGWCRDSLTSERWNGKDTGPPFVVRGGAAIYWPWQNTGEWLLALSAVRQSSDFLEDRTCSAHAVAPLKL